MSDRFAPSVLRALQEAGWREGRCVPELVTKWELALRVFGPMHEAARAALLEFGGLRFDDEGPGLEKAREAFALDPMLVIGEDDRFAAFEPLVGRLYPIGIFAHGRYSLGITPDSRVYILELDIYLVGLGASEAIGAMLLGKALHYIG